MGENGEFDSSTGTPGVNFEKVESRESMAEGNQLSTLVEWLNVIIPDLNLPLEASEEDLRACLADGTVLCSILNKLSPGLVEMDASFEPGPANVKRFLAAMDDMGLPRFESSDLEQGYMVPVVQCLRSLRASFSFYGEEDNFLDHSMRRWDDVTSEESALMHHLAQKFHDVLQLKEGCYADVSDDKILEFINSSSIDNASTKSLFSIVNRILDECTERKNGDVPHRVAWLLRIVVQLIERRTASQYHNFKNQNNLFRAREEKYKSRIKVIETLAKGTAEEHQVVVNELERIKSEKTKLEQKEKLEEQNVRRLKKENGHRDIEISALKQELETAKRMNEMYRLQMQEQAEKTKVVSEKKLKELELLLIDSKKKVEELESFSESKSLRWKMKECTYQSFINHQFGIIQDLRIAFESTKHEVLQTKKNYLKEFDHLGLKLTGLIEAAENYHEVLSENRRLYNEVQDLKGNIRVYCRIRPFLPGQTKKQTTIEYIGENGDLVVSNPLKHGKENHRLFKFNKVFGPETSQEEVFLDTQPLIRSVLDGFNVCIFAYGQTGSGKTYTMSGPSISATEDWGVNYRALNDLFQISQSRKNSILYEVGVQMVEIYNEQVRDLLSSDGPQKRLGIWNTTLPNGLAVPEASMYTVKSTTDVLELMNIGLMNRAVCATALNERSSRSHSVLTVHVRGTELQAGATLRGSLHLIDLAGSERVDRSEATGDRLKEAQHINKSLSALGDVISALAQKSSHVPYRNSKLTQVLQSSLGGQAKTLMFVQLNPDIDSYSETISTLKFAERVSGVELGAARSNKEGRDVKELMEQVSSLKDIITKKDEEIERLQVKANGVKHGMNSLRYGSSSLSPGRRSAGSPRLRQRPSEDKRQGQTDKAASDMDNCSEGSDKHSEAGSHRSMEDIRHRKEWLWPPKVAARDTSQNITEELAAGDMSQNVTEDFELLGFGDGDSEERLSDISDGDLSMGTETDGSMNSAIEFTLFPETAKPAEKSENTEKPSLPSKLTKPLQQKQVVRTTKSTRFSLTTKGKGSSSMVPLSGARKTVAGISSSAKTPKRWH